MSHPSKVAILIQAQAAGFRTYLYFVATDDPAINISRVRNRVALKGHDVPEDKMVTRYHRSLDLLVDAIWHTNRAYIFDNSGDSKDGNQTWLAEITEGRQLELKTDQIPAWFKRSVLDKIFWLLDCRCSVGTPRCDVRRAATRKDQRNVRPPGDAAPPPTRSCRR